MKTTHNFRLFFAVMIFTVAVSFFLPNARSARIEILHTFDASEGSNPHELVQTSDGDFYGITQSGGPIAYVGGTVFKLSEDGSTFSTLFTFYQGDNVNEGYISSKVVTAISMEPPI